MYRPLSAGQPNATGATQPLQMNPATPTPRPNPAPIPFAGPFQPVGVPRPAPFPAPSHHTWRPPAFPLVSPPGAFRAPAAYQPPPPPPGGFRPPPGGFHPGTPVHQFGLPGFRPSHTYPRVNVLSHQRPVAIDGTFDRGAMTGPHIAHVTPANVFGPGSVTRQRPPIAHVSPTNVFGPGSVTKPRLPIAPVPQAYVFGPGTLTRPPVSPVPPANVFGPRGVTNPPIEPVPPPDGFVLRAVSTPHIAPVPQANVFGFGAVTRHPIAPVPPADVFGPGVVIRPAIAPVPPSNVFVPRPMTRPPIAHVPPTNVFGPGGVTRPIIAHVPPANVFVPGAVYRPPIASIPPSNYFGPGGLTRPPVAPVPPANGPQYKVYVGKIASTVDNDFVLSLLQVCGHVKSWNPVTNPIDGTPTGFGFCDFESAEDSLCAWRLLNKLSIDGRELLINVNEATKEHLQKHGETTIEEKASKADKDAIQTIHNMIEERMRSKLPESIILPVKVSGKRQREEDENLAERKVLGLQGWQHREVTSAGKSSLQIDAIPSIYMPMECRSIVEHERKRQHRERWFHKNYVPVLCNSSTGENVGFELQATSTSGNEKTLDAEQLLAAVPKMKEELFAYDVNWAIYDKHGLHERMRHWVSEKCIEVFGEEIPEFVEYVVASTKEHVEAPGMLEPLASLMDDSAENFLLSLWAQLIFEIKKAEAGLA